MTLVIMTVTWFCLRCRGVQRELTVDNVAQSDCWRLRQELVKESYRQQAEGFPRWSPIFAECMVKP
jgi:hypothetical protein